MTTSLALTHRRLSVVLALAGLVALLSGGGAPIPSASATVVVLIAALFWRTGSRLGRRLEQIVLPVATLLLLRAFFHIVVQGQDAVFPVVDLLFLLLAVEAVRPLDSGNEVRLHALGFALLLAATAYRPGILFGVAFVAFIGLGILALVVGHFRESEQKATLPTAGRVPTLRPFALLLTVTLVFSGAVFLTFPRLSSGWLASPDGDPIPLAGFGDPVTLGSLGTRILPNPQVVFRVQFPDGRPTGGPLYWRGRSYDHFDGLRWSRSSDLPPSLAPGEWVSERWPGRDVRQVIRWAGDLDTPVLFALHPVLTARVEGTSPPFLDGSGDLVIWGRRPPEIHVTSRPDRPPAAELRDAGDGFTPGADHFVQLPPVPPEVAELARTVTRHSPTRYDRVRAIERWFHTEFAYTLELPASPREATVPHFLLQRREGHCEYFASGMVLLLRSLGIHSRLVNGFLGGQWNETGNFLAVSGNQAHAWVEVWFPGYGWVPFDPTPPGSGALGWMPELGTFDLLVDGLRFRWNRWVLGFGRDDQEAILDGLARFTPGSAGSRSESAPFPPRRVVLWLVIAGAGLAAVVLPVIRRRWPARISDPATRGYLALRRLYRPWGIEGPERLPPRAFLRELHHRELPGGAESTGLVQLYLESRFGDRPAAPGATAAVPSLLRRLRRKLRKAARGR